MTVDHTRALVGARGRGFHRRARRSTAASSAARSGRVGSNGPPHQVSVRRAPRPRDRRGSRAISRSPAGRHSLPADSGLRLRGGEGSARRRSRAKSFRADGVIPSVAEVIDVGERLATGVGQNGGEARLPGVERPVVNSVGIGFARPGTRCGTRRDASWSSPWRPGSPDAVSRDGCRTVRRCVASPWARHGRA